MRNKWTALTGCAGEHFVAYKLSAMGYIVALTRSGSPSIDLMVASPNGNKTVTIQVKTGNRPHRTYRKQPSKQNWSWPVGDKAKDCGADSFFYAFIDLKTPEQEESSPILPDKKEKLMPDVFIVPASVLARDYAEYQKQTKEKQFWFGLGTEDKDSWRGPKEEPWAAYYEAWHLITKYLG